MDVEIWSDIACPWCYIGKRRFEAALSSFEHADEVNVTWRSFELDPAAPAEVPGSSVEMLSRKYGMSVEQARAAEQRVTETAAGDGLEYNLGRSRLGSTFDGHRLVHLAKQHGLQDAMKERLFRARFTDGGLLSDRELLLSAALDVGLPEDEVRTALESDRFAEDVREDEATASAFGISGVPMFVVDRQFGASGAQAPEQLLALLRHGWENRQPASA
ncbi:MAG TPA: DsbA family oxidoreductase [Solirubrobacteraceae bacterium]|nr:DsbA family oxidoreductase [Solirubrobacteraceae bacterium]